MITVLVKKDDATVIPVQHATLEDAQAYCEARADVVDVKDADGNSVSFAQPAAAAEPAAEAPAEAPIEPAPANE